MVQLSRGLHQGHLLLPSHHSGVHIPAGGLQVLLSRHRHTYLESASFKPIKEKTLKGFQKYHCYDDFPHCIFSLQEDESVAGGCWPGCRAHQARGCAAGEREGLRLPAQCQLHHLDQPVRPGAVHLPLLLRQDQPERGHHPPGHQD